MNVLLALILAGIAVAGPLSAPAAACGGPGRPPCSILRPPAATAAPAPPGAPRCALLVGGIGMNVYDPGYTSFAEIAAAMPGAEIHTFSYDTYGPIAAAALALRDEARRIASGCSEVHIVAHSMGGVVADRAFSLGLGAADRVTTYVALASPHNGATAARLLCGIGDVDERSTSLLRAAAARVGAPDVTATAVCDLAATTAPRPPRGVDAVRLRLVTDEIVLRDDWADRRADARELLPQKDAPIDEANGHAAILRDARVLATIRGAARDEIASDARDALERAAAVVVDRVANVVLASAQSLLALSLWLGAGLVADAGHAEDGLARVVAVANEAVAAVRAIRR